MTNPSVHDNCVYAYSVLAESGQIILHAEFREKPSIEYTDVVFKEVVAHHFECSLQSNILSDIAEVDLKAVLEEYAPVLQRLKNYGWPIFDYADCQELERVLRERGIRGYLLMSSYGLTGFVFALSVEYRRRDLRAFSGT